MGKVVRVIAGLLIIAVLGFLGWRYFKGKGEEGELKESSGEEKVVEEAPVPVKVVKAVKGDLPLRISISAISDVWEKATVKAETSGRIVEVLKGVGEKVKPGEVVILLDEKEKRLALQEAEAARLKALSEFLTTYRESSFYSFNFSQEEKQRVEKAKQEYERALSLFKAGKMTAEKLQEAEDKFLRVMVETGAMRDKVRKVVSGLTNAEINLAKARLELERAKVKAPFSGIISEIKVAPGETVTAGTELFRIVNLNSLYLKAYALESEVAKIKRGMGVRIKFAAFPDKVFYGRVKAVSPELDPEKKTAAVYIELKNPGYILPGMNATAEIEYKVLHDVVKVPRKAILVRSERPLVFVVKESIALWRYVELGAQNDEEAEIKSGVEPGELVVVEGHLTLAHQSKVKIVK